MNYNLVRMLLILFYCNISASAMSMYDSLKNSLIFTGRKIESIENVPVINKLTNFLPFAVITTSFQQCPGQSLLLIAGLVAYYLYNSELIQSFLDTHSIKPVTAEDIDAIHIDNDLFIFEGDDEDDAIEQEEIEDELLDSDYKDITRRHLNAKSTTKFL